MYFNPRSREGSDMFGHGFKPVEIISIHAPVKGATTDDRLDYYHHTISIHAPVKGATDSHGASQLPMRDFNPRSREGSDMVPQCQW